MKNRMAMSLLLAAVVPAIMQTDLTQRTETRPVRLGGTVPPLSKRQKRKAQRRINREAQGK